MSNFWLEYLHFDAMMLGILVSVSSAALFLLTYRYEKRLRTIWRSLGFLSLAAAFFLFILERKFPGVGLPALLIELFGFFSIYKGVRAEPQLKILQRVGAPTGDELKKAQATHVLDAKAIVQILLFVVLIPVVAYLVRLFAPFGEWVPAIVQAVAWFFILLTIPIQIKRYRTEANDAVTKRQNLWPMLGYFFLLVMGVLNIFYRLPTLSNVALRQATLNFSAVWILGILFLLVGFFFLAIWAWNFIKLRVFLRTYVVFLAIAIFVSSLGSAFFTQLIFSIVERNNLTIMSQSTESIGIVQESQLGSASLAAHQLSLNAFLAQSARTGDVESATKQLEKVIDFTGANYVRLYNGSGTVLLSPQDPRDVQQSYIRDKYVAYALTGKPIKSFDTRRGVQADVVIARAIEPLMVGDTVVGAIEVGYIFDTPFVDFAKARIGSDVTIYAGDRLSATTITTEDGKARWIGAREPEERILTTTLTEGKDIALALDRLGRSYYSAFTPIQDVNGVNIGMVSVGSPTFELFEKSRQQLITTFLIATIISLLAALIGYWAMRSFREKTSAVPQPGKK